MSDELPAGWAEAPLADISEVIRGVTYDKKEAASAARDGYLPILRATNIARTLDLDSEMVFVPEHCVKPAQLMRQGDIVVAASSGSASVVGKSAQLRAPWVGGFGAFCSVIRPSLRMDRRYLALFVAGPQVRRAWRALAQGTNINNLKISDLATTVVPLPPFAEQERIVAAIEEQFSRVDAGDAALGRIRQNLKRMRAAIIENAVLSGKEAGAVPVTLGDLVACERKIAYGVLVPGDDVPSGIRFVRIGDLKNRKISTASLKRISQTVAAKYPRTSLQGGEVLLSLVGTIGRAAVVPTEFAGANVARALAVIPVRQGVDPRYIAIALSQNHVTVDLTNLSHEVARKTLNLEDVRRYAIPLPPHHQQLEIVERVENAESWLAAVEQLVCSATKRSERVRSAVLAAAFAGRLVPQEAGVEPASSLLERIAAERASSNGRQPAKKHPHEGD